MGTPLGEFIRAKRDATAPAALGIATGPRRRAPGLRRTELAELAGVSVEYLTRIEQGKDRNPSIAVVSALAQALALNAAEHEHLRHLTKITAGVCAGHRPADPPYRDVRPEVRRTLDLLEPGVAYLTNRLGDVLAYTCGFESLVRPTGLLDGPEPNLTRYVFTDERAQTVFPDWDQVADERAFELWLGPSVGLSEAFQAALASQAGAEFTSRLERRLPPPAIPLAVALPDLPTLRWDRQVLGVDGPEQQLIVVLHAADAETADAFGRLQRRGERSLRAV